MANLREEIERALFQGANPAGFTEDMKAEYAKAQQEARPATKPTRTRVEIKIARSDAPTKVAEEVEFKAVTDWEAAKEQAAQPK